MRARDWRYILVSVIAAGFLLAHAVPAAAQNGSITGTVTNATTGAGVPAVVQVWSSAGSLVAVESTNSSGLYTVTGLTTGSYYVRTSNLAGLLDQLYQNVPCNNCPVASSGGTLVAVTSPNPTTIGSDRRLRRVRRLELQQQQHVVTGSCAQRVAPFRGLELFAAVCARDL
jgi:hypothetical protein